MPFNVNGKYTQGPFNVNQEPETFAEEVDANTSTGVVSGGTLSLGSGSPDATFSISAGHGFIVDDAVDPPTSQRVTWNAINDIAVTDIATQLITFVSINELGAVVQQTSRWTSSECRQRIILGVVVHIDNTVVDNVNQEQATILAPANMLRDLYEQLGFLNVSGNALSANGANLQVDKSGGVIGGFGINFSSTHEDPNNLTIAAGTAYPFQIRTSDGTNQTALTNLVVDPDMYESAPGVYSAVGNNKFTVMRFYLFTSGNLKCQPGQFEYADIDAATGAIPESGFVTEASIAANGLLIGYLAVKKGVTALNGVDVQFVKAGLFGSLASGGVGVVDMQETYDNLLSKSVNINSDLTFASGKLILDDLDVGTGFVTGFLRVGSDAGINPYNLLVSPVAQTVNIGGRSSTIKFWIEDAPGNHLLNVDTVNGELSLKCTTLVDGANDSNKFKVEDSIGENVMTVDSSLKRVKIGNNSGGASKGGNLEVWPDAAGVNATFGAYDTGEVFVGGKNHATKFLVRNDATTKDLFWVNSIAETSTMNVDMETRSLLPLADVTYDIGSSSVGFSEAHVGTITTTGTALTVNGEIDLFESDGTTFGDAAPMLTFNTDRAWSFTNYGTGTTSTLALSSASDQKIFRVGRESELAVDVDDCPFRVQVGGGSHVTTEAIVPRLNTTYDLGSTGLRWNDLWTTSGSIETSDKNAKEDIQDATLGLDFVEQLKPKTYRFKNKKRRHYGFLADEVKECIDTCGIETKDFAPYVDGKSSVPDLDKPLPPDENGKIEYEMKIVEGYAGLRYSEFVPILFKAVQELGEENRSLKRKFDELDEEFSLIKGN